MNSNKRIDAAKAAAIAEELAKVTGEAWKLQLKQQDDGGPLVRFVHPSGLWLYLHQWAYQPKASVSASGGPGYIEQQRYTGRAKTIHVTPTRPAAALAKDIARRIVPDALAWWSQENALVNPQ